MCPQTSETRQATLSPGNATPGDTHPWTPETQTTTLLPPAATPCEIGTVTLHTPRCRQSHSGTLTVVTTHTDPIHQPPARDKHTSFSHSHAPHTRAAHTQRPCAQVTQTVTPTLPSERGPGLGAPLPSAPIAAGVPAGLDFPQQQQQQRLLSRPPDIPASPHPLPCRSGWSPALPVLDPLNPRMRLAVKTRPGLGLCPT